MTAPVGGPPGRAWAWAMLACAAAYVALFAALGRFLVLDEVFFKAPGLHWARTGRLAAPELTGFLGHVRPPLDPPVEEVWFVHPPVYPLLFGLYTRAVGFGPRACVVFDALIHALLALLTYATARRLGEKLPAKVCFLAGVAVLPVGIFGRPDELATCFGTAGLLTLLRPAPAWRHVLVSGVCFGLCAATSVGAAVMLGLVAVTRLFVGAGSLPRAALRGAVWGTAALAVLALAVAPVLLPHPAAYRQYLAHAADHVGRGSFLESLFTHWENEQFHRSVTLGCLLLAGAGLLARGPELSWLRWWLGPALGLVFLAVCLPDKIYYTWFLGPWMVAAAAATARAAAGRLHPALARGVALVVLALYAVAIAPFGKGLFAMATLPAAQRLAPNAQAVRALIPPGSTVLTDDYWWILAEDCRVYDLYFGRPAPAAIDFIILTGNGSGDPETVRQVPAYLAGDLASHFRPVLNTVNTRPVSVLGRPIPNTAFGFGALVLRRADETADGPAGAE